MKLTKGQHQHMEELAVKHHPMVEWYNKYQKSMQAHEYLSFINGYTAATERANKMAEALQRLTTMNMPKGFVSCQGHEALGIAARENCNIAKTALAEWEGND